MVALAAFATTSCKSEKKLASPTEPVTVAEPAVEPPAGPRNNGEPLTDSEIEAALDRELAAAGIDAPGLETGVILGVVELTGQVPNLLAKKRATRIAGAIKGVRSVIDRVEVKPVSRPDDEIATDIKTTMALDPAAESYEVEIKSKDGVVTLTGEVDSWQERQLAESLAMQVAGVKRVKNQLTLDPKLARTDHEIRTDVESRLEWDILVDHELIGVTVDDGEVTLAGLVGSVAEKSRAAADAWVAGARSVDVTGLDVDWIAADAYRREAEIIAATDAEIRQAISDAILFDPRVKSYRIDVDVTGGGVTLEGAVPNMRAKRAVERIAEETVGVMSVTNRIEVKSKQAIADKDLVRSVTAALALNPITESQEIAVTAEEGTVTLRGTVETFSEKAEATAVAMRLDGVNAVVNEIEVSKANAAFVYELHAFPDYPDIEIWSLYVPTATHRPDPEIEAQIMKEILFDTDVDLHQVDVDVTSGEATLTGEVDSRFEALQAELNALQGGATSVDNKLTVRGKSGDAN